MTRLLAIATTSIFVLGLAGAAQAMPAVNGQADSALATTTMHVQVRQLPTEHSEGNPVSELLSNPHVAQANAMQVQSAIRSNPALVAQLQGEHVEIDNAVAATQALDGGLTIYLR